MKYDLRRNAGLVARGDSTEEPMDDNYAGVIGFDTVFIAIFIAILNDLHCVAADIGNAYLNSETKEKIYVRAGPEFGKLEGNTLIVVKVLYGLKTSVAKWHEKLADTLRILRYEPSKVDPNLWIKDCGQWYEYIATYVDDLLIFSKDPIQVIKLL